MADSYNQRTALNGSDKTYAFTFPKLQESHVYMRLNGADLGQEDAVNGFTISGTNAIIGSGVTVAEGDVVRVYRNTPRSALVDFQAGKVKESSLDTAFLQALYIAIEARDRAIDVLPSGGAAGAIPVKASSADYDMTWDTVLASSVAEVISDWGTDVWANAECVAWNTTPQVNQDSIIEVVTGDQPGTGTLGNAIKMKVDGDFEIDFRVTVENDGSAGTIRAIVYHKPDGGSWTAFSTTYLVQDTGEGSGDLVNLSGCLVLEDLEEDDRLAILLSPTNSPTNWQSVDIGSALILRRIG